MTNNINNSTMLRLGTILHGTYRIDGYLSSGGFGNTYVATNIELGDRLAVKEFFMKGISQRDDNNTTVSVSNAENKTTFASQLEKFKKEARRLHQLHNEHIVYVYDLFEENGTAYYVMDYVDGESLSERLKRTGVPMSETEVLHILPQILDALAAAHNYSDGDKQGIFHLDLKPANIMNDKQGNIKLIDFGASKQQSAEGGATTSTAVSYTQGYAPREQMEQNLDKFGPWTDFYALGATLYTLLTNKKPPLPSDIDDDETPDKHLSLLMPPSISKKTKRLVLWLMNTNRKKRPQSVEAIQKFLESDGDVTIATGEQSADDSKDDDDETKVAGGNKDKNDTLASVVKNDAVDVSKEANNPEPQPQFVPIDGNSGKRSNKKKKVFGIGAVLIVVIIIVIVASSGLGNGNKSGTPAVDSKITAVDTTSINTEKVTKRQCHVAQGYCTYTGSVNEKGMPDGEGEAWFKDGRYYKGLFSNGMMVDDDAFFRFPNGDTYQGSFVKDHFSKGRYTMKEDQSYFVGTYDSNGQPKDGAWYDKNGNKIQNV